MRRVRAPARDAVAANPERKGEDETMVTVRADQHPAADHRPQCGDR